MDWLERLLTNMCKDIYKAKVAQARKNNLKLVKKELEEGNKEIRKKIKNFHDRHSIPIPYIEQQIQNEEPIALAVFSKDPSKQKVHENTAAEFIEQIDGVKDFENLPNDKLYVSNGAVISKADLKHYPDAKTVDFKFTYEGCTVYCSHKYTEESGGAQDNQYRDLQSFIKSCNGSKEQNIFFIAIADGEYYQQLNGKAGMTKINNLRTMCTPRVKVCTIYGLEKTLKDLVKNQIHAKLSNVQLN